MNLRFKSSFRAPAGVSRGIWPVQLTAGMSGQGQTVWVLQVYYRRLIIALSVLVLAGWLLAATLLFFWLDLAPHNQVRWLDLAAPWRWPGLRAKHGDTAVLTALDQLKAKDFAGAFYNLRVGVARSPGNVEGRLALARLQAGYDPVRAVGLLEEGLPFSGTDPRFLSGLVSLYASLQIQSHALEVVGELLRDRSSTLTPPARFVLQRAQVGLLIQLGRYAEADAALAAISPPASASERASLEALQTELLLRSGRALAARKYLEELPGTNPVAPVRLRQAAEIAIALGDADALLGALRRLKGQSPDDPGAYLYAVQAWHRMKRPSLRDAAEADYYRAFGGNDGALQALAALAVNLDLPEVVARAQQAAVAGRHSSFAFRVHQTELALRRGETEQATRLLRDWENNIDTLRAVQRFYPEFIKRLTRAAFAGTPDQVDHLLAHLTANRGQAQLPAYTLAVTVLEKSGNPAGASQVLQAATRLYPQSEPLLVARERLTLQLAAVAAPPGATAPSPAVPGMRLPATAEEARRLIDEQLQNDSLVAARDLLRIIRAQKPAWLSAVETEISLREVELAFLSLDQIAARDAARAYIDRHRSEESLLRLVTLVPRLIRHTHATEARLLYDEIAAAPPATTRVQLALRDLNLADDLAAVAAQQPAALAALDRWILT